MTSDAPFIRIPPIPSARTLLNLFTGGYIALMAWEIWSRTITVWLLGGPLEPPGLVLSLVNRFAGTHYDSSMPIPWANATFAHYVIGIVGYPLMYYIFSRGLKGWDFILDAAVWLIFTVFVLYALATGPAGGASVLEVRSQQAPWLASRSACLKSKTRVACVRDLTLARIAAVRTQSKAARSADAKGTSLGPFAFRCETPDGLLNITYVNVKPGFAWIARKKGGSMLQQQRSGSGARYEGDGTLFWEAQGEARWRDQTNDPEVTCKRVEGPGQ